MFLHDFFQSCLLYVLYPEHLSYAVRRPTIRHLQYELTNLNLDFKQDLSGLAGFGTDTVKKLLTV